MEALKPKPAKKSRKPKGAAALSEEVDVNDVNGKNEENVKKVTAYLQYRAESASGLSSNLLVSDSVVPEATDSEAQRNKSIEIVVPIASPERVAISAFPKEPVAVPPPANEPETCVRPREDIASVPPPTEVTASAPPPIEVIASARSPVAISAVPKEPVAVPPSANEPETCVRPSEDIASAPPPTEVIASVRSPIEVIASARSAIEVGTTDALANQDSACADSTYELEASAPPDDEPLYSKIYPDLPTLEMSEEAIGEEDTVDVTAIDLPAMLSDEEKMQLFSGVSIAWLEEGERWFVNQEKSAVFHPNDDKEWSRQKLQQKLTLYGRLHHQLTGPFVEQRKATQSKLTHLEDEMWRLEERIFESNGVCQDHREIKARAKRTFAVYDGQRGKTALATLSRTLDRQIREEKAASMERQDLRIDLQYHFVRACGEPENKDYLTVIIIVLAEMLRNEAASQSCTMRDSCPYQRDLRLWFRFVCARYMKTLELSDRQYVLYHVLRLPGGIKSWAVELVQMLPARRVKELAEHSNQALATHEVREILIMLNIVMRPVAQRNALYRSAVAFDEADQYTWVDSDGEGEDAAAERTLYPLTEDDMNALLEQLPVPAFMQTLKFHISQRNCLAGIITAVEFTQTLLEGCRTYGLIDRYRNFTKRLGRLIDHTVSYTNWLLQEPLRGAQLSALEKGKIVVEYDRFVYETVGGLYQVRSNALWQCLASLPFDTLTMDTLERMISEVRSAQLGACELPSNDMWEENILKLGNDEFYYVLQIMTNMATAQKRLSNRLPFVTEIAETLMKLVISFDTSEPVKVQYLLDQLRVLIDQYPTLISAGLQLIDKFQQTVVIAGGVKNVLTVFDAHNLPMRQWTPTREDLDALLSWFEGYPLLSPLQTVACHLLMSIYYGENSRGELAVPREWQLEIVRKIVVTCGRLAETTYGNKAAQNYQVFVQFEQRCK
ncbi:AGAP000020-PA-like protein [Anopheles sinensis]|uniref:AGAP000020-PA-like protein n=1 Tax=Anopheles sinensis TaxID=74873 RepID=A0A084WFB8_ANOSI|nr:AGAP000020-PA-like protein [Anopheles sinensis]